MMSCVRWERSIEYSSTPPSERVIVAADRIGFRPTMPARSRAAVRVCENFSRSRNSERYVMSSASAITAGTMRCTGANT